MKKKEKKLNLDSKKDISVNTILEYLNCIEAASNEGFEPKLDEEYEALIAELKNKLIPNPPFKELKDSIDLLQKKLYSNPENSPSSELFPSVIRCAHETKNLKLDLKILENKINSMIEELFKDCLQNSRSAEYFDDDTNITLFLTKKIYVSYNSSGVKEIENFLSKKITEKKIFSLFKPINTYRFSAKQYDEILFLIDIFGDEELKSFFNKTFCLKTIIAFDTKFLFPDSNPL